MKPKTVIVVVGVLLFPLIVVFHAWVLMQLWRWFILPTFGLAVPSLWMAAGISLVAGYLTHQTPRSPRPQETWEVAVEAIVSSLVGPLLTFVIGAAVHVLAVKP